MSSHYVMISQKTLIKFQRMVETLFLSRLNKINIENYFKLSFL